MDRNNITEYMPHPVLTKLTTTPTFSDIHCIRKELYANAASIATPLGGGNHGYLGMLMEAATYGALNGAQAFNAPTHPGAQAAPAADATGVTVMAANRAYDRRVMDYRQFEAMNNALRRQIIAAVPRELIATLADPNRGFSGCTPKQLLDHLVEEYGTPTQAEIEDNRAKLTETWNPDTGIISLWAKITDIRAYATMAEEDITDAVTMRLTLGVLEKSGVFSTAISMWNKKDTADKTWTNFKTHFAAEDKERRRLLTSAQGGYQEPGSETAASAEDDNKKKPPAKDPPYILTDNNVKMYYCWTHGLGKNRNHTSCTCKNKAEGHKDEATADNMMGGCNKIMSGRKKRDAQE